MISYSEEAMIIPIAWEVCDHSGMLCEYFGIIYAQVYSYQLIIKSTRQINHK